MIPKGGGYLIRAEQMKDAVAALDFMNLRRAMK
jgi:hypothetical protein